MQGRLSLRGSFLPGGATMFLLAGLLGSAFRKLDLHTGRLTRPRPFVKTPREHQATAQWILRYTNQARARHKLPRLQRYLALQSAAQGHSNWMAQTRSFSHLGHHGVNGPRPDEGRGVSWGYDCGEHLQIHGWPQQEDLGQGPGRWLDEEPGPSGQHHEP